MEQVLEVIPQQKKVRITLDRHRILLSRPLFRERPLAIGDMVDWEELEQWILLRQYRPALEHAVAMLAARDHSTGEIREKLLRTGYLPVTADMVVTKLQTEHLVNNESFARQWAEARARRKLGKRRIAMELRQKGIDQQEMEDALSQVDDDEWLEGAKALVRRGLRKKSANQDSRKEKLRIFSMLARRGYPSDVAREAWEAVHHDDEADEA